MLIIGDSVTHGTTGDWTWRYRLWEQFQAAAVPVDFVGPRDDLFDIETGQAGSHGYLDPAFDQDHAAQWGLSLGTLGTQIGDLVATYHPDVLVEMLGINDIVFGDRTTTQVLDQLDDLVADARAADPDVDVVLVPPFQQWFPGVPELDAALPGLAADLDGPASRVAASDLVDSHVGPADSWDGGHAAATGELKIAVSVAAALGRIGVPVAFSDPPPVVENGPPDPARLVLRRVGRHAVDLSWQLPLGANQARMWQRDRTTGERWQRLPYAITARRWAARHLVGGHLYTFRLQAAKGSAVAERVFSRVVRARTVTPR